MLTIGGYEIVKKLGSGGMGVVYEARDPRSREPVALKQLHSKLLAEGWRSRFATECEALTRVHHRGVARFIAKGEEQGEPFLVFELVAGRSLTEHLKVQPKGALPPPLAVRLCLELLDALAAVHA